MNTNNNLYNFLTSNFHTQDPQKIRKLILLNSFMVSVTFSLLFFAVYNFFVSSMYTIALLNAVGALVSIFTFFDLRHNKNLERASNIAALGSSLFFIFFTYYNQNDGYGLFWVSFTAVFTIGLLGTKKGLVYLVPYFSIIFYMAYLGIGEWANGEWCILGYIRLVFSSLLITFIVILMDLALVQSYKSLEELTYIDSLTKIDNRRSIQEKIELEMQKAKRSNSHVSIILFDIDNFKNINDTKGHNAGDKVLQNLAQKVKKTLRSTDSFGRWGGEEFLIVLPNTSKDNAENLAEKIRQSITDMVCDITENLSCSFGVTVFETDYDTIDELIERVDSAMYKAKKLGKNRVEVL